MKVHLRDLLENRAKYQGQVIETEGELFYNFEYFRIHYYDDVQMGDTTIRLENFIGLSLNLHPDLHFEQRYLDSLRNKWIKVRGVFDTINYEVSGLPNRGVLKNIFYFQPVEK